MNIRDEVKREMADQEITGYKLAQLSGVKRALIYAWLKGHKQMGQAHLEAIIGALGLLLVPGDLVYESQAQPLDKLDQ